MNLRSNNIPNIYSQGWKLRDYINKYRKSNRYR